MEQATQTCEHKNTYWVDGCGYDFLFCRDCGALLRDDFNNGGDPLPVAK